VLAERTGARSVDEFQAGLECLRDKTSWTEGEWELGGEIRPWNSLQNVNRDVALLKHYLIGIVKADLRRKRQAAPAPLFEQAAK
jgi:hypothetical protein